MTAQSGRARQMADRIRVIVAESLERRIKDPRLGFVTITDSRVTGDLHEATLYYTVLGSDEERLGTAAALESAKGVLRSEVGRLTGVRFTPTLTFVEDAMPVNAEQIEDLLRKARDGRRGGRRRPRGRDVRRRAPTRTACRARTTTSERMTPASTGRIGARRAARRGQAGRAHLARRGRPGPPTGRHPQGRPRRHARPDGHRRAGARHRPGDEAARPPRADRQVVRRDDPARRDHDDRRRRGRRC